MASYVYTKIQKNFGAPYSFEIVSDKACDIQPNADLAANWVERKIVDRCIQSSAQLSEHSVNTERVSLKNSGMLHAEGGWPKEIDYQEVEATQRYRKRVAKSKGYVDALRTNTDTLEALLRQNNALDITRTYFPSPSGDTGRRGDTAVKTLTVIRDPEGQRSRWAGHVSWSSDGGSRVAVAYHVMDFQHAPLPMPSYVWSTANPSVPDSTLLGPSPLTVVEYLPKDTHVLAAGMYNGCVATFDVRTGSAPTDVSPIEKAHQQPVFSLKWVKSKSGTECATTSTDGLVLWWDIRKLGTPLDRMLAQPEGATHPLGGTALDYDPSAGLTKFLLGTESGAVVNCNKKGKTDADRLGHMYRDHYGPITSVMRSPFYPKFFLTTADWTARLWHEDIRASVFTSAFSDANLTCGVWSPTRPGVFTTGRRDGVLDIWDLYVQADGPVLSTKIADAPIRAVAPHRDGDRLAIGCADGSVSIVELGDGLVQPQPNEKQSVAGLLEREAKREKNLDMRHKEMRLKQKKRAADTAPAATADIIDGEQLREIEDEFFALIKQQQ